MRRKNSWDRRTGEAGGTTHIFEPGLKKGRGVHSRSPGGTVKREYSFSHFKILNLPYLLHFLFLIILEKGGSAYQRIFFRLR